MIELVLCTVIWGASFVAQKLGADSFGPCSINCYRNILAALFLFICVRLRAKLSHRCPTSDLRPSACLFGGALSGIAVVAAELAQQIGIERTTPGVSAFLTANYVLLVPFFAWAVGRGRPRIFVWIGVLLALTGTYFISIPATVQPSTPGLQPFSLGPGEAWTLLCAAFFAVQILIVDRFAPGCDMLRFSMVQMAVAGLVMLPFVFLPSELARASWGAFVKGIPALVFLGIFSSGIAYTLQNLGQAKVPAPIASIVMSLEGVFAVLFGWILLGDVLAPRQILGCSLVLSAVLFAQLFPQIRRRRRLARGDGI